jgi:hypothetical protein
MRLLRIAAITLIVILVVGFAVAWSAYDSYAELAELNRKSRASFASWEAVAAPRRAMFRELAELVEPYDAQAAALADESEDVLRKLNASDALDPRIRMHKLFDQRLKSLMDLAERYPQLRDSREYAEWKNEYLKNQIQSEGFRENYNSTVREYNSALETITGSLIAFFFEVPPKPLLPTS